MIKLSRGERPEELTQDVCEELTQLYIEDRDKDVWNSPKIKKSLKDALLQMSHNKCAYCECIIGIESKDVTIDHFLPKTKDASKVVEWENLFPACLRCNRDKNDNTEQLVNPCLDEPKEYIGLSKNNPYRLKEKDIVGGNTIKAIGLNNIDRVMTPRMAEWEKIHNTMSDIYEDFQEEGFKKKYQRRFGNLMENCTRENSYAAVKATNMLNDELYIKIKDIMMRNEAWSFKFDELEKEMKEIALELI